MPSIPLPFIVSILLIVLLLRLSRRRGSQSRFVLFFVASCALTMAIVGIRWSADIPLARFLHPVVASLLPGMSWIAFSAPSDGDLPKRRWMHTLPSLLVLILSATWPFWHWPIDFVLASIFMGYGAAFALLAIRVQNCHAAAQSTYRVLSRRAFPAIACILIASGAVDLAIAFDFTLFEGNHAAGIVATANIMVLPILTIAVGAFDTREIVVNSPPAAPEGSSSEARDSRTEPTAEDLQIVEVIDSLMREKKLFRDPSLNLARLARKSGIPSRQLSLAVNRVFGQNVSRHVNAYRVAEAQRLLLLPDLSVTEIQLEVGFQTKSNFNREFSRIAGVSPSKFRRSHRPA